MNRKIKAMALLLSISGGAAADEAAILRCRGIAESAARLACYDAAASPAADTKATASKSSTQPEALAIPSARPPVAAATDNAVQQKTTQFGLENRAAAETLDAIESYIPGRFEGWEAKSIIKLANGQAWQIADDSSRFVTLNDPKVRIRRGALGSFHLEFEKINYSPRVRRVQ